MSDTPACIEQRVFLSVSRDRVWAALTNADDFAAWWGGPIDRELEAGRTIVLTHGGRPYTFEVVEMVELERLTWRWHPGERHAVMDYSGEEKTYVSFTLAPFHDGVLLTIRETGFDVPPLSLRQQAYADNVRGWAIQAAALMRHFDP
jgi:uncharacterized protein YndB with AHSA1/START domain